jgi:uncharacterized protein
MAPELPQGIAIESIFVIEATYAPDAAETRPAHRAEHVARLAALREAGVVIEAGAFEDLSGSLVLVRAADAAAVRDLAVADVYVRAGVWVDFRIRPFGRVCRAGEAGGR